MEGLTASMIHGGGQSIFPRVTEEVEGKSGQIKDGVGMGMIQILGKAVCQGAKDGDVDGPDASRCGVFVSPGLEEGLEVEGVGGAILLGIQEAQLGKLLPHGA